ncbi:FAD binding domain protein [Candidatus Tiddalikarchaeum anstoanum]|nr:FAD binding domain protein [Candidatus Tiddalikarchaeum anstoanum]
MKNNKWDYKADIVVVGSGAAAYSAAITAKSKKADVIMIEKGVMAGGTTLRSGGGFWTPNNRFQKEKKIVDLKEDAVRYMARYSYPQLYNPEDKMLGLPENEYKLITTYYDNASKMADFMIDLGALKIIQEINWTGKPQVDYMDHLPENKGVRGRVLYSMGADGKLAYGGEFIRQLKSWADGHKIPLYLNHRVTKILKNDKGEVIGLEALKGKKTVRIQAKKAVIFGTGGYTHNKELMLHFQRGPHFGGCAAPTNTGDFVLMAEEIGAKLGNMAGAFRAQIVLEEVLSDPNGVHNIFYVMGDSILEVNKYGKRIVDEKRNYSDRTMVHFLWDPQKAEWTNMLVFMVYDERTAMLWQGFPPLPVKGTLAPYIIDGKTLDELADNIKDRLKQLAPKIGGFNIDESFAENFKKTVAAFNDYAKEGVDAEFHRGEYAYDREWTTFPPTIPGAEWPPKDTKNYTMYPLSSEGPYHAVILGAGTLDTNGGPVINPKAQVLDTKDAPIPGLYGAGDCIASPTANAYWGAGSTIGPALTYGHIAALNAVKEKPKK